MSKISAANVTTPEPIRCVIYIAKSTMDTGGSLDTQRSDCLAAVEAESKSDGRTRKVLEIFEDENKSGWKGNRGEGLAGAKRCAVEAAETHGEAELWVQHSDRIARGDGRTAAHLGGVYFELLPHGIRLRSVQDDSNLEDAIRAVLIGERNNEDSNRKSEAVKSGKQRAYERGEMPGGGVLDGYRVIREIDPTGRVKRTFLRDPDRAKIIERIFELAVEGLGDASIAREMNAAGYRTRGGRGGSKPSPWRRNRIQATLTNPTYAGAVTWRGKVKWEWEGPHHPALVEKAVYERLLRERAGRDKAVGSERNPKGRPSTNHALANGLGTCNRCEDVLRPRTSTYWRKDGTRRRTYLCRNVADGTGLCDAPVIDAEIVDRAVIADLDCYLGDIDRWRERFTQSHEAERVALAAQADQAQADINYLDRTISKLEADVERHVGVGDSERADAVLDILTKRRPDRALAERRLQAVHDALAAVPEDAPIDGLLDFYNSLSDAVKGRLDRAGRRSMGKVNEALGDLFEMFVLDTTPDGVVIVPILLGGRFEFPQTAYSVLTGEEELPPLRQLSAPSAKVATSQAYRWTKPNRPALAASQE